MDKFALSVNCLNIVKIRKHTQFNGLCEKDIEKIYMRRALHKADESGWCFRGENGKCMQCIAVDMEMKR